MIVHEWNQDEERSRRESDLKRLRQTEGWNKLTDRQRKTIELSLYIQQRAERGTDFASLNAIEFPGDFNVDMVRIKDELDFDKWTEDGRRVKLGKRKYDFSQNNVARFQCYSAVAALEGCDLEKLPHNFPDDFFEARYFSDSGSEELARELDDVGYPCVLFANIMKDYQGLSLIRHALVVMGRDSVGKTVVWEKVDAQYPYRVVGLDEALAYYRKEKFNWGVRTLRRDSE